VADGNAVHSAPSTVALQQPPRRDAEGAANPPPPHDPQDVADPLLHQLLRRLAACRTFIFGILDYTEVH